MPEIKKVLIANRGEIALRIIRSLKEMRITTVAVYSEADRKALHVRAADEAYPIGPPPSSKSYLNQEKILEVAKKSNADAIHPGYGFLSENADFAKKCQQQGLIFIGPSSESIMIMGSKIEAKAAAMKFNIPMVPGTEKAIKDPNEAKSIADSIGYPVLIKASAGGGGKGMRIVNKSDELVEQFERAVSEALSSFGDGSVFIEKYITNPAHIEIQILGDQKGNILHLFERECSIQRRYQKVVEEAPSPKLSEELRKNIGEAAVLAAKSCNYYGAGTVEFILDENKDFYFLEMNTRLQVEHPVTEFVTGLDLVKEQVRIAEGKSLNLKQEDIQLKGHAIELRVYAEDPQNNFVPDTGKLRSYVRPQGPGIRVDDGFEQGMDVEVYYDPMIAKLIVYADTRDNAIEKMKRAIDEYIISGVKTTLDFGKFVMDHPTFRDGSFDTHFVQKHFNPELLNQSANDEEECEIAAYVAAHLYNLKQAYPAASNSISSQSNWKNRKKFD